VLFDYPFPPSHIVTHTVGMAHLKVRLLGSLRYKCYANAPQ